MDPRRAFYVQAAEAAAATTEDDAPKLTPSKAGVLMKFEGQGVGLGGGGGAAADVAPHHGSGQCNGAALVAVDGDKASCEGGGTARDQLICPECGKAFLSDKAMYGHLRCHPERGYKGATRPAAPATAPVAGGIKPRKALPLKGASVSASSSVALKEGELPTRWPVTARRGRTPTAAYAARAAPAAVMQSSCSEEDAAMILLGMSSGAATLEGLEPELHMQPMHAPDAVEGHLMPGLEQLELADHVADSVAMDLVPETEVEHPMMPEHAAGAVVGAGQHVWEAEKPVELEPISKVVMEPQSPEVEKALPPEHVTMVTAASEVETTAELEPVEDAVLVAVREKDRLVSPGSKKSKKRRLDDLVQTPPNPTPAAEAPEDEEPEWRLPSPGSNRKHGCTICYKKFPTYQALGGHMASHTRVSKFSGAQQLEDRFSVAHTLHNIMAQHHQRRQGGDTNVVIPGAASGPREELRGIPPPLPAARAPLQHPCSRCSLVFRSGQALGGHMRKHWLAEKKLLQQAAAAAGPSVADAGPSAVPRDFDLNELPRE